jgi:hypothetical protein
MLQGRDGIGAAPCCGTGVVFRRDILISIGGQVGLLPWPLHPRAARMQPASSRAQGGPGRALPRCAPLA